MTASELLLYLKQYRLPLHDEKLLQAELEIKLKKHFGDEAPIRREVILNKENIIDFMCFDTIGIEVKIKGNKRSIYKQCERYCMFTAVKELILITNMAMGMPPSLHNKNVYVLNLGKAWL